MAKRSRVSKPQNAASEAEGQQAPTAPAGSAQGPATDPTVEAAPASSADDRGSGAGTTPGTGGTAAEPSQAPAAVASAVKVAPKAALKAPSIVVKAKPVRGRWRAGRKFTREATVIALADLGEGELAALKADSQLVITDQPGQEA